MLEVWGYLAMMTMMTKTLKRLSSLLRNCHLPAMVPAMGLAVAVLLLGVRPIAAQVSSVSYAYSANNNSIESFKVDPNTGRFAPLSYLSLGGGTTASSVALLRTPTATFLYVARNDDGDTLASYSVNLANGQITFADSAATGNSPTGVVVDPTNQFVYVANTSDETISAFKPDVNGNLTSLGTAATGSVPFATAVAAGTSQTFVYTANAGDSTISVLTVCAPPAACSPVGSLMLNMNQGTLADALGAMVASPDGQFLYVTDLKNGAILGFTINPATGALFPIDGSLVLGGTLVSMAIDPKSQFLYAADASGNGILAFSIQPDGTLVQIGAALGVLGVDPNVLVIDPSGKYLYVSDQGSSLQETYLIGPGGGLTFASSAAARAGNLSFAVTQTVTQTIGNEYFYATNTNSNTISAAPLDVQTGDVGTVTPTPAIETLPVPIVADPLDQHVFVANGTVGNATLTEFSVVAATGALVNAIPALGAVAVPDVGNAEVVDPSGQYLYVAATGTSQILLCNLNNGLLGSGCTSQDITVVDPVGLAVSPTGQYLFVLGTDGNDDFEVYVFAIDPSSGNLVSAPAVGSPYLAGNTSTNGVGVNEQIAVDPSGKFVVTTNGSASAFTIFSVDGNGMMVKLANQAEGGRPQSLVFDATGSHLYEIEGGSTVINTFQFDPNSGAVNALGSVPVGNIPGDGAIDATGNYFLEIAVADDANLTGSVVVYPISPTDGTLGAPLSTTTLDHLTNSIVAAAVNVTAGSPSVTLIANQLTFPITTVNVSAAPMNVTLHNFGTGPLTISSILINGGANPNDFTLDPVGTTCSTTVAVPAAGTCILSVIFTPTAVGNRSASLTLIDNAFPATQSLPLFGSANNPGPSVTPIPDALTFPITTVGSQSAAMPITVNNFGGAPLIFTSLTVATGANPGDFALDFVGTTCSTQTPVAAGGTCVVSVIFTPTAAGARSATLTLADNATPATQTIPLTGTGAAVGPGDFTIIIPETPQTPIHPGQGTTIVVTITPGPGLKNPITFVAPGPLPTGLCVIYPIPNPATVTSEQTFTFHITTTAKTGTVGLGTVTGAPSVRTPGSPTLPRSIELVALCLALACLFLVYREYASERTAGGFMTRRWALVGATSLLMLSAISFSGCGGGSAADSTVAPQTQTATPTGTYQITLTATAGTVSHSVVATVQLQ